MNFRSLDDLGQVIVENLHKIPRDVDLVVGIPRSGLLTASIIALHLNIPFTDLDGFLTGKIFEIGRTRKHQGQVATTDKCRRVLVVDDSVNEGTTLETAKKQIAQVNFQQEILYAAIFVIPEATEKVDIFFEICPIPRLFEWNMLHHPNISKFCIDIDGVLCLDPTPDENDDGVKYTHFLKTAKPVFLPRQEIGYLVTCRLEKYRTLTTEWLSKHNIRYKQLIMMDFPDKASRKKANVYGKYKAEAYIQTNARLFIESSHRQSVKIANLSNKPVLCIENRRLILPAKNPEKTRLHIPQLITHFLTGKKYT